MGEAYQALNVPPAARERGGFEFLRCAIVEGELHVTLRPVFNQPEDWGRSFAEVARQVASAYAHQNRFQESDTLTRITSAFETEMKSPPQHGTTVGPVG